MWASRGQIGGHWIFSLISTGDHVHGGHMHRHVRTDLWLMGGPVPLAIVNLPCDRKLWHALSWEETDENRTYVSIQKRVKVLACTIPGRCSHQQVQPYAHLRVIVGHPESERCLPSASVLERKSSTGSESWSRDAEGLGRGEERQGCEVDVPAVEHFCLL